MADVSFAFLDQNFDITDTDLTTYSSTEGQLPGNFGAISVGGDEIDYFGTGFTYAASLPTAGEVTSVQVDPDNDGANGSKEIIVTGLSLDITDFDIGVGTAAQQNQRTWALILGGDDTLDFTMSDYSVSLTFAADGSSIADGSLHVGGNDSLLQGASSLTGFNLLYGDFEDVGSGVVIGGDDFFDVGAYALFGDVNSVASGSIVVGGDDVIAPVSLLDNSGGQFYAIGDANSVGGALTGGDDLIDLRSTDVSAFTQSIALIGDAYSSSGNGVIVGGDDTIHGSSKGDTILGDNFSSSTPLGGDDLLYGYAGDDVILGGSGADTLTGGAGADTLVGEDGVDTASYADATGAVTVRLFNGTGVGSVAQGDVLSEIENLVGSDFNDALLGADAIANRLEGGLGNDNLYGLTGDDVLIGGAGVDRLDGGGGTDTASYADATGAVTVKLWNGTGAGDIAAGDTLISIENVIGSVFNDALVGADGVANTLRGGAGNDNLYGLGGDDLLIGGTGADVHDGGAGVDTVSYADATGAVSVKFWNGTGSANIAAGDSYANIENVIGSDFADALVGADGVANTLEGRGGNDNIFGLSGNDILVGSTGSDMLQGGAGADVLSGGTGTDTASYSDATGAVTIKLWNGTGAGNVAQGDTLIGIENILGSAYNDVLLGADGVGNRIEGANGNDNIYGLGGDDTFVFRPGDDADTINDFVAGAGTDDMIEFIGFGGAFDSFGEIVAASSQVGLDTVINFGGGDTITLVNVTLGNLHADDFLFA